MRKGVIRNERSNVDELWVRMRYEGVHALYRKYKRDAVNQVWSNRQSFSRLHLERIAVEGNFCVSGRSCRCVEQIYQRYPGW